MKPCARRMRPLSHLDGWRSGALTLGAVSDVMIQAIRETSERALLSTWTVAGKTGGKTERILRTDSENTYHYHASQMSRWMSHLCLVPGPRVPAAIFFPRWMATTTPLILIVKLPKLVAISRRSTSGNPVYSVETSVRRRHTRRQRCSHLLAWRAKTAEFPASWNSKMPMSAGWPAATLRSLALAVRTEAERQRRRTSLQENLTLVLQLPSCPMRSGTMPVEGVRAPRLRFAPPPPRSNDKCPLGLTAV